MSQCWPEGALRAQLDRELAPEEMDRVAAHLAECPECARLSGELAARAERVGAWLQELPEVLPGALPMPEVAWVAPEPRRANGSRAPISGRWWIGLAAAAGLILAALFLPRHQGADTVSGPAPLAVSTYSANIAAHATEPPAVVAAPARIAVLPRRVRRPRLPVRTVSDEFLALDDEPFETGVVMRVGVEPGNVQADVVFGPDGRAHAIRLVSTRN
jgi:hypothetical protein